MTTTLRNQLAFTVLLLLAGVFPTSTVSAQCSCNVSEFGSLNVSGWTVGQSGNITTCQWGGERGVITNTVAGAVYRVSSCGASYDTQLTIYTGTCGFIAYNDDNGPACTGLAASVDFTSPGGTIYSVFHRWNCNTEQTCATVSVTLLSLPAPPVTTPCTGCGIFVETGTNHVTATGCQNGNFGLGSGAYFDLPISPNTYYNFSFTNTATNINGFCATPQGGTGTAFTSNQSCWFSGTTSVLRVSANRSNCTWTGQSATLTYRNTEPTITGNLPANITICEGNAVTIDGATASCGTTYWQNTTNNGISTAVTALSNSTGVITTTGTYNYYYRPNNNGCWGPQQATVVTVQPGGVAPASAAASPASVCPGGGTTLSVIGGTLGTGDAWTWYEGGCGNGAPLGTGVSISVTPAVTTTYYVRAEGGCGETLCASVQVIVNTLSSAPTGISASSTNVCSGDPTTLTVAGGALGSAADWRWYIGSCGGQLVGGGPSITVSPQSTANYFVRAEGPCGNTTCASVVISVTQSPSVGFSGIQSPSGCGNSDGTITAIANGGQTPYSFSWSNGGTQATISGLSAGPFIVTVTDANGCSDESSVSINDPNASVVTFANNSAGNTLCAGDVVTFTASGAFQYQWFVNGVPTTTQNPWVTNTIQNGDQVSVLGVDVNFCSYTAPGVVFIVRDVPVINASVTDPTSCGGVDGAIQTNVSGGSLPYSYLWNGGAATPDLSGLAAGPYFVTVTDLNGCASGQTFGLSDPGAAPVSVASSEDPNNVICEGETVTFTASGSQNYEFYVNASTVGNANPYVTTTLTSGQSVVAIGTDINGCTATSNIINMTVNPGPIISLLSNVLNETICVGQDISFFAAGGLEYEFFVNGQSQGAAGPTSLFIGSGLQDGDVVVVVGTDANQCDVESAALTVTVNPAPVAVILSQQDPSECGATDGVVVADATGGTQPYDFQWAAGPNADTYPGLAAGSYFVTVTDDAGCTSSTSASLSDVGSSPVFLSSDFPSNVVCGGVPVTFTATGATTYVYYVNGVLTSTDNPFVTTLQDGDIIAVTGLDTQLCAATSAPVEFIVHPEIQIGIVSSLNPSGCQQTDGAANTITIGGTPQYIYSWTNGQNTPNATNLPAGQWAVTVTDANGCADTDVISLSDIGADVAVLTASPEGTTICQGTEVMFTASGSFQYEFFLDGISVSNSIPYVNNSIQNGETVALVGTDINGCVYATPGLTYTVNNAPNTQLPSIASTCSNIDVVELAGGIPAGGTYSVDYAFGGNTFPVEGNLFFPELAGAGSTTVNYLYTSQITGCVGVATANITVYAPPSVDLGGDTTACVYDLDAGAGFVSYLWCGSNAVSQTISTTVTDNYCVRVEDANGCFGYDTVLVQVLPLPAPVLTPGSPVQFCTGGSVIVSAQAGFNSYAWSGGTATQQPSNQSFNQPGNYSLSVTNSDGCIGLVEFEAIENEPQGVASIEVIGEVPFCFGESVILQVEPVFASYLWNTGSVTNAITVTQSGSYWLTTLDANGCIDSITQSAPVDVLVWNLQPQVAVVGSTLIVTDAENYTEFQWLLNGNEIDGATDSEYAINPTGSGNYEVQVTDENGCTGNSQRYELTCCVGIEETGFEGEVNVYPNPNNGEFIVDVTLNGSKRMSVELHDMVGRVIWSDAAMGTTDRLRQQYDIRSLPAGIYMLRVMADSQMSVVRLIKQ